MYYWGYNMSNLFEAEQILLNEALALVENKEYGNEELLEKYLKLIGQFDKLIRDVEKIIRISDGQQEYLHKIQNDLKKEIEERTRAEEKLKYFAAIDALTGCYNRGMGLSLLENEIRNIKRNNGVCSVCFLDVNKLKYVNDNFGHFEGDELLVLVCKFIKTCLKDEDILCRLGGDEFIIIFPGSIEADSESEIRRVIKYIELQNKNKLKPYNISFSYGIVEINHHSDKNIDEIIQMADEKMYEDKERYK
jgi:two-component system cell cycle response regulator